MKFKFWIILLGIVFFPINSALAADELNAGDTAWIIVATALVMMMTPAGLALFYGGMSRYKNLLNTYAMTFCAYCLASIVWVAWGYSLSFGSDIGGLVGSLEHLLFNGIDVDSLSGTIPTSVFAVFQMTFAGITVCSRSGFGGGSHQVLFLARIYRSVDYRGLYAGMPLGVGRWLDGPNGRPGLRRGHRGPHQCRCCRIDALPGPWQTHRLGQRGHVSLSASPSPHWAPHCSGSAGSASTPAASWPPTDWPGPAFLVTNTSAATGAMAWMLAEWFADGKPSLLGIASGAVAGLVAITPAAGFVNVGSSLIMGLVAGILGFIFVAKIKHKLGYDDSLDAFGVHGICGIWGALATGLFANPAVNDAGAGLFYGNPKQVWIQLLSIAGTAVYSAIATLIVIFVTRLITGGMRIDKESEIEGLDNAFHGERGFEM